MMKIKPMLFQIAQICRLIIFCFIFIASKPAYAQHNDAIQLCKIDRKSMWYFAIGRTVFRIDTPDYSRGGPLVNNLDPRDAFIPPTPTSQVGCKGNPQQLAQFSSGNWPRLEPEGYIGNMPYIVDMIALYRYPYSEAVLPNVDPAIENFKAAAINCETKKFIMRYADGTFLCSNKLGQLNPLLNTGQFHIGVGWEFIISGNLYLTPLGQNLVASENTTVIETGYRLTSDTSFGYKWFPPKDASNIDASYLIQVDKLVRSKIFSYQIKNYPWPKQANNQ